ncbi:TonB-dependent receptor domain-containing protein [Qipengyuania sp.]|uniref:TonB-dependent receptor domain-containing protein n=1 Tax=Qipengyuania sp. TaxID=2004515 RepID=UPI0035C8232E
MKLTSYLKISAAPAVLGLALIAQPTLAQDTDTVSADERPTGTAIVVTGSRIASPTVESPAPLQVIDDQVVDDAGVTNIQELLLENPVFGTPALSRTNSAFLTSGTGVATVDLRDLGSDRTLVLIDGRRVVASLPGSATVDLNVIPTQFIERIDILTGGASALYGSDAIAGVVNFVYKTDFEGVEANAQYGITERGDDARYQANVTAGANVADGRGNIMLHLGYSNEEGLLSRQRSNTRIDDGDRAAFVTGDLADFGVVAEPFFSSFPPQGRFIVGQRFNGSGDVIGSLYTFTYGPNGQLQPCFQGNASAACSSARPAIADNPATPNVNEASPAIPGIGTGFGPNGFNRQNFRTLAVPVERYLFAARGNYELTDDVEAYFEGTFNRTTSSRIIEPFPLESGGANGVFPTGGGYNIENYLPGTNTIVANPLVPAAILAQANDTNGDGLRDIGFARRLSEFGPRAGTTSRDFYRFVVGARGDFLDNRFTWDLSYNYGEVAENQTSSGQVNVVNFRDALAVRSEVGDENGNGIAGEAICVSAEARANGCVPANIFGAGALSQAAIDYIQAQGTYQTGIRQSVVQGLVSGSLFDLPAGPVGIAVGGEYRKESSFEDNDALTNAGLNAGNKLPDTSGSFDVSEVFAEVKIPILADTPGFELLEIGGAIRYADYSTVGGITSYNGTVTWQPFTPLRLRGTYAKSVRAPNVGELFSGLSQTFPSGLTDPCVGIGATGGGATGDNCRADPGVAANIAANGVFTLNQADLQGISGFNGGNPNLEEEESESYTFGGVFDARSLGLGNLTLTADYYNISIDNVIASFPRQFSLDQCYGQGNQTFCDLITRRGAPTAVNSAGSIDLINALAVNAAILETEGLDVTLNYSTPIGLSINDRVSARVAYTHVFRNDYTPLAGEDVDPAAGEIGTPEDKFTANVAYGNDDFRLTFTGTYIGRSYEDQNFCAAFDAEPKCVGVGAEFYLDTQATFYASDILEFYVGADNLLDNDAPNLLSGTTFNVTGTDTAADVYDVFGRRYYFGVRMRF